MRYTIKIVIAVILFISLVAFTVKTTKREKLIALSIKPLPVMGLNNTIGAITVLLESKDHSAFLEAVGFKESGNNYDIVNTYGHLGKYQFGYSTLKGLGYRLSREEFLNSPYIQEAAMQKLLEHNRKKLTKYIDRHSNTTFNGVFITESGVLAAAHLAGAGNVRKWFRNGKDTQDGYGTSMTYYMSKFQGYNLDLTQE